MAVGDRLGVGRFGDTSQIRQNAEEKTSPAIDLGCKIPKERQEDWGRRPTDHTSQYGRDGDYLRRMRVIAYNYIGMYANSGAKGTRN